MLKKLIPLSACAVMLASTSMVAHASVFDWAKKKDVKSDATQTTAVTPPHVQAHPSVTSHVQSLKPIPHPNAKISPQPSVPTVQQVKLYAAPNAKAKVLQTMSPFVRLVPIYRQGPWVKVGRARDGQVGWINVQQYRDAREAATQADVQSFYINVTENDKGKRIVNVMAYKNGKRVSDKEAMKLYKQMRKDQKRQRRAMRREFMQMRRAMNTTWFGPGWGGPIVIMPGPAIDTP